MISCLKELWLHSGAILSLNFGPCRNASCYRRPGRFEANDMPAASLSSNLGGMGIHWTCACPRPGNEEKIPFIPEDELEAAFVKAEELLQVTQKAFPITAESENILKVLYNRLAKIIHRIVMPNQCR